MSKGEHLGLVWPADVWPADDIPFCSIFPYFQYSLIHDLAHTIIYKLYLLEFTKVLYIVYTLYIIYLLVLYSKPQLTDGVQVSYTNIYLKNRTSFFNEIQKYLNRRAIFQTLRPILILWLSQAELIQKYHSLDTFSISVIFSHIKQII